MIKSFGIIVLIITTLILSGCSSSNSSLHNKLSKEDKGNYQYKGHYKIGNEYKIKGKKYKPYQTNSYTETGIASWYGGRDHGKNTANGDKYNKHMLSAAHKTLPLPSLVKVTNLKNNRSLIVMVNDRGPFIKGRIIDVSEKAAKILGFKQQGVAKVKVQYLHKETEQFLHNIALAPKHGAKSKQKSKVAQCTINCHVKLVNLKNKLAVN